MVEKGKRLIYESFEDRKFAIAVGFFCLLYFLLTYLPLDGNVWIAKILPHWPLSIFIYIAGATVILQGIVWKLFHHFYPRWFLNPLTLLLFLCEFGLILFTVMFFSWPVFWLMQFLLGKHALS